MITAAARKMMQRVQLQAMQHTCLIEPYIVAGDGTVSYGSAFETVCGFDAGSSGSSRGELYETAPISAQLRLPLDVQIGVKDRVTIISAYGEDILPMRYEVSRIPTPGPSAQTVSLAEVYT